MLILELFGPQLGGSSVQRPPPNPKRDSGRLSGRALRGGGRSATADIMESHSRPRGESSYLDNETQGFPDMTSHQKPVALLV